MAFGFRTLLGTGLVVISLFASSEAFAQYYTFAANARPSATWQPPPELIRELSENTVDLLHWLEHKSQRPLPKVPYDRKEHYGTWIEEVDDPDCYDVRTEVLIRDSETKVQFSKTNPCKVASGRWTDPYSGHVLKDPHDIEIDHVVALKNSYDSGGWGWKPNLRCAYANFMGFKNHLIAASSAENQAKSDKAPDGWMPSNTEYGCQHLHNWMLVKLAWNLNMSRDEARGIANQFSRYQCDPKYFKVAKSEIIQIRQAIQAGQKSCDLLLAH